VGNTVCITCDATGCVNLGRAQRTVNVQKLQCAEGDVCRCWDLGTLAESSRRPVGCEGSSVEALCRPAERRVRADGEGCDDSYLTPAQAVMEGDLDVRLSSEWGSLGVAACVALKLIGAGE
jgi:hypothetical protein